MPRNVWVASESRSLNLAEDLFQVVTSGAGSVTTWELHELWVSQSTDAGDAEAEQLTVSIKRRFGASLTPGFSQVNNVPRAVVPPLSWPGNTETDILVQPSDSSGGSVETYITRSFDVRDGLSMRWLPRRRPQFQIGPESFLIISLDVAPADLLDLQWGMMFSTANLPT